MCVGNVYSKTEVSQQKQHVVTGIVKDNTGEPLVGVSILISGHKTGTITDTDGKYRIDVPSDGSFTLSFIGFKTVVVPVKNRTSIDIVLEEDVELLEEVVVVGYGTQQKVTLTGAVSAVKGAEIVATKNENVQNMLTGKVPGVRVTQKSSEPGAFNNNFDIRGMGTPLVVIDGVPRTMEEFQRLNPEDIDNLSVLKDASAAIYGVRSANGVVLVITKKGSKSSKPQLSYSGVMTWQVPSGMFGPMGALDYLAFENERSMNSLTDPKWVYSDETIEAYRNGTKKGYDWYGYEFRDYAPETQHNASVTGGNDRTNYYVGMGYLYQNSFFKTDDRSYNKYNVMSNISTKITNDLTFDIHLSAIIDQKDNPNQSAVWTIRDFWRMNPLIGPYADSEETMYNHQVTEGENPVSFIHSDLIGWEKDKKNWYEGMASLNWNVPYIKGLSAKGMFSYNFNLRNFTRYRKEYYQYRYEEASDSYQRYTVQSPSQLLREAYMKSVMLWQFILNYDRTFGLHKVNGTLVWESQIRNGDNFNAQRNLVLELPYLLGGSASGQLGNMNTSGDHLYKQANNALAGKLNYAFANKYLVEGVFRYDGSSKFALGYQWGFFPAASVGWRISEENFIRESGLSFIRQLKLRASYGMTGDDASSSYQFISGYNYPTGNNMREFSGGYVFDGTFVNSVDNKGIPNPYITWFTSKTFDLGVDFEGWDGLFGFSLDYFDRHRKGLLARQTGGIPTVVGAQLPEENLESDKHFGLELTLTHRNKIQDFSYKTTAMASITRRKRLDVEHSARGSSWSHWKSDEYNRLQGVYRGFNYTGQFTSWDQIRSSPYYIGRGTLIGDYMYEDWNGDGEINDNDIHPIRFNQNPWVNFSLLFEGNYRRFDLNLLFHGSALGSLEYGEQMRGDSNTLAFMLDRWHPVDPKADPYDPATEWVSGYYAMGGRTRARDNSTFNVSDASFLRLKSIELGYTLPQYKGCDLRLFANGYNIFTITPVRNCDPEHPGIGESWGYMYPLNKTFSLGLSVKF
ncbi:SusC/RagA family TonB-linked outer membrane protein [Bacteroidia bacterium]|nr:SusC/RagA family TonB-linked outer membrane protein [Bacteroidia bacterium]